MSRVFLTDAQQRKTLAAARSLGARGVEVLAAEETRWALTRFSKYCRKGFVSPNPGHNPLEYHQWLLETLQANPCDVMFPMDDNSMAVVMEHREAYDGLCRIPLPGRHSYLTAADKALHTMAAVEAGLDCPRTLVPEYYVFVLGYVARKYPHLIQAIAAAGHEIGSHGFWHGLIYQQTREDFRQDVLSSKGILEDLTGKEVRLYRAPSWSISVDTLWALQVLEETGFWCDSSIQPFKTPLSGINGAPAAPFHPVVDGRTLNLIEFPPTVLQTWVTRLLFAGGFYLRALPGWFVAWALAQVNKNNPGMVYVHPWEIDPGQPRLDVPLHIKITHYYNLRVTERKLEMILKNFSFVPLGELIEGREYPAFSVV